MYNANLFTGKSKQELEDDFQDCLKLYRTTKDPNAYTELWLRVFNACYANGGKILKGIYTNTFEDRIMDATIKVMGYILAGNRKQDKPVDPKSLINYTYFPTLYALQGAPSMREDQELSYEEHFEKYEERTLKEQIRGICRKELMCTRD